MDVQFTPSVQRKNSPRSNRRRRYGKWVPARFPQSVRSRNTSAVTGSRRFLTAFSIRISPFAHPTHRSPISASRNMRVLPNSSSFATKFTKAGVPLLFPGRLCLRNRCCTLFRSALLRLSGWLGPALRLCSAERSTVPERAGYAHRWGGSLRA